MTTNINEHYSPCEDEIWQRAEYYLNPAVWYSLSPHTARSARDVDRQWFTDHPSATVRIRRMAPAESGLIAMTLAADPGLAAYAILIHHARLKDKRAAAGVGIYPCVADQGDTLAAVMKEEARALLAWYANTSADYVSAYADAEESEP